MIDDPEIIELGRAQRRAKLKKIGIVSAIIVAAAVAVIPNGFSVASELRDQGYSDVEVTRKGVFDFSYQANKGDSRCGGSIVKLPGSMSNDSFCYSLKDGEISGRL